MVLYDTLVVYEWPVFGTVMFPDCQVPRAGWLPSCRGPVAGTQPLQQVNNASTLDILKLSLCSVVHCLRKFVPVTAASQRDKDNCLRPHGHNDHDLCLTSV